jgi:glycosyltransferase involved in cell wall biosynthesis
MSLYIDLSEFLVNPIRTGIQRISGEMCRYLPKNAAIPVRLDSGHYVGLPPELIPTIGAYFMDAAGSGLDDIRRLSAVDSRSAIQLSEGDMVLVPEVFDNPQRLAFFRGMPEREFRHCRFIVYDLLPATHPEYFTPEGVVSLCGYFNLLRRASRCGFISKYSYDTFYGRFKRTTEQDGVVLPLGSDALGPRAQSRTLNRPLTFSVLGTIEPRKNHELILNAFEPLLQQIDGLSLSFIGKMGWVSPDFESRIRTLAANKNSGFRFFSAPGDGAIRNYIEQSRATIYVSAAEGYGLPPVESLWVGTPVIASATIPSLQGLATGGVCYVDPLNVTNLRRAVLAFREDDYANQKIEEAMNLNLPTWRLFTEDVLQWCTTR